MIFIYSQSLTSFSVLQSRISAMKIWDKFLSFYGLKQIKANHFFKKMRRENLDRDFEVDLKSYSEIYQPSYRTSFHSHASGWGTERDRERPYAYRALSILHKTYSCFLALLSIRDCLKWLWLVFTRLLYASIIDKIYELFNCRAIP